MRNTLFKGTPPACGLRKAFMLCVVAVMLQSCSALRFIPGWDRIFHKDSTAQVGPLIDEKSNEELAPADPGFAPENTGPHASSAEEVAAPSPLTTSSTSAAVAPTEQPASQSNTDTKTQAASKIEQSALASSEKIEPEPKQNIAPAQTLGGLRGKVIIRASDGTRFDTEGTLIRLVPQFDYSAPPQKARELKVVMQDKSYQPGYVTVNKSDLLTFVNADPIKHNVFSSSGKNAFDLGTYGPKLERSVRLNEAGIAKVYCNIHSEMVVFIAVAEAGMSAAVDDKGNFYLPSLPAGNYTLHAWNIRGELEQTVTISANQTRAATLEIDGSQPPISEHKNKHGEKYAEFSKRFGREFY